MTYIYMDMALIVKHHTLSAYRKVPLLWWRSSCEQALLAAEEVLFGQLGLPLGRVLLVRTRASHVEIDGLLG